MTLQLRGSSLSCGDIIGIGEPLAVIRSYYSKRPTVFWNIRRLFLSFGDTIEIKAFFYHLMILLELKDSSLSFGNIVIRIARLTHLVMSLEMEYPSPSSGDIIGNREHILFNS
jgi:hypothetical protein